MVSAVKATAPSRRKKDDPPFRRKKADPPFRRETITSSVAAALRRRILAGGFAEGTQLRQDAIATEFGVSRIPVREALRQLEAEGLVTFFAHRGAVVSGLSLDEIREMFHIRRLLECDLLRQAVPCMDDADLARAGAVLQAHRDALAAGDVALYGELNWRFHAALYAPAGRPKAFGIVETVNNNVDRYLRMQLTIGGASERANAEHGRILELCRVGRVEEACDLLGRHIENGGESLIEFLERQRKP